MKDRIITSCLLVLLVYLIHIISNIINDHSMTMKHWFVLMSFEGVLQILIQKYIKYN